VSLSFSFFRTFTNVYIHSDYVYDTGTTTNTTIVPSHHGNGGGDSRSNRSRRGTAEGGRDVTPGIFEEDFETRRTVLDF
jgi:hypothetical protein